MFEKPISKRIVLFFSNDEDEDASGVGHQEAEDRPLLLEASRRYEEASRQLAAKCQSAEQTRLFWETCSPAKLTGASTGLVAEFIESIIYFVYSNEQLIYSALPKPNELTEWNPIFSFNLFKGLRSIDRALFILFLDE